MPFTSRGLEAKRFSDILPEISDELISRLGIELDTTPDTVLGVILSIFASEISTQEALTQAMADNFDIDKATGVFLDSLVALNSLTRLDESNSIGSAFFKVSVDGTTIPITALIRDSQSNVYRPVSSNQINSSKCTSASFTSDGFVGNFTVSINGTEFTKTYSSTPTEQTVAEDLQFLINQSSPDLYTVSRVSGVVTIAITNKFSDLNVTRNENIRFTQVEGRVSVIALDTGVVNPPINTVKTLVTNLTNVQSVTNYDTFTVGRLKESDTELRIRHQRNPQISRNSTTKAIFSRLANLSGVSLVRIFENTTNVTDSDGRPSHSYECIIEGGNEQEIAENIFDSKPAGVETYGSQSYLVNDYSNSPSEVNWSRPNPKYVNVKISYSRYGEETFPDNAVQAIKEAVVLYGDNLGLDVDIIPQRMYGVVYGAVAGIGSLSIEVGTSLIPSSETPNEISYTTNTIPISKRDKADFNTVRIQVVEV
jgi:uncharacterized phage protein gp47/JayE